MKRCRPIPKHVVSQDCIERALLYANQDGKIEWYAEWASKSIARKLDDMIIRACIPQFN